MRNTIKWLSMYPSVVRICVVLLLLTFCDLSIQGQTSFGRISGTITDQTGAVVPHAKITITNNATKIARTAITNGDGFFVADDLPSGTYIVTAEQDGFKTV